MTISEKNIKETIEYGFTLQKVSEKLFVTRQTITN